MAASSSNSRFPRPLLRTPPAVGLIIYAPAEEKP
jgi:hypothetical protein